MSIAHVLCLTKLVGDDHFYIDFPDFPQLNGDRAPKGGQRPKTVADAVAFAQNLLRDHFEQLEDIPEPKTTWAEEEQKTEQAFSNRDLLSEEFEEMLFLNVSCHSYGMGIACVVQKDQGELLVAATMKNICNRVW
jgi:hypothetical protein